MPDQTDWTERKPDGDVNPYRVLPSVDQMLADPDIRAASTLADEHRGAVVRRVVADLSAPDRGRHASDSGEVKDRVLAALTELERERLVPVINATGVIIHTNLGGRRSAGDGRGDGGRGERNVALEIDVGRAAEAGGCARSQA